jgi:hypothetical protein
MTTPVPLDDELPPDPEDLYGFADLEELYAYLQKMEVEEVHSGEENVEEPRPIQLLPDTALPTLDEEDSP